MSRSNKLFFIVVALLITVIFITQGGNYNEKLKSHRPRFQSNYDSEQMKGTRSKTGTVWPLPRQMNFSAKIYFIMPHEFQFTYAANSNQCPEVQEAISRYMSIMFGSPLKRHNRDETEEYVDRLSIYISSPCEIYPNSKSSESYILSVSENSILVAETQWGILRGMETFSQLIFRHENEFLIRRTDIEDYPRFKYRGLMLDTARHFMPVGIIQQNLEIMSYNKLNVLHWHITDDQSFPIEFKSMPELAKNGAYVYGKATYSEDDVKRIVEFARMRGIRVIPEIDFPSHTKALSKSRPDLLIPCFHLVSKNPTGLGSLNPLNPDVYTFVGKIYSELKKLFPDEYMHLGGDEVPHECWLSNPDFEKFEYDMKTSDAEIHQSLIEGLIQEAQKLNLRPILWDDAFNYGYTSTPAIVEVWFPDGAKDKVAELTNANVDVIISYLWYLDNTLKKQWREMYVASPTEYISKAGKGHILGGEACMWSEYIEPTNIISEIWPLTSAVAERLWSSETVTDVFYAENRLNNFRCVLKSRNVHTSPVSPGYCRFDFD